MRTCLRLAGRSLIAALALAAGACEPSGGQTPVASERGATATPAPVPAEAGQGPVVVMLGDSLTAGYELPPEAALPAAIQRRFDAAGVKAQFVNSGVSGNTTADGLERYDWSVEGAGADLLVIALGANDFLQGVDAAEAEKNLSAIIERAQADGVRIALVGVAIPTASARNEREAAYAAIYARLSQTYGLPLFPDMMGVVSARSSLIMDDGVHPTAKGVEAMAEPLAEFLKPIVGDLD